MHAIDFSMPPAVLCAVLVSIGFVPVLYLISRIPGLRERNALQFLLGYLASAVAYLAATSLVAATMSEWITGMLLLQCAALLYLEAWALLSRGYTLGLLLTLYRAKRPVKADELANDYRGGDGLEWIMKHRLAGLAAARLVTVRDGVVTLTSFPGLFIAKAYKLFFVVFGLRKTG